MYNISDSMEHLADPKKSAVFNFPEVRVVEASAGSGKTYALAKRYVQLLLSYDLKVDRVPIKNILALTFTNKAAFEMKERIIYFLKGIALDQLPASDMENILGPIDLSPKEAQQKAFHVMEGIIHYYHFFQVQTIDKFINTLLSGCAFKIGLTSSFKIRTTAAEYLQSSLDRLIDQASYDQQVLGMFDEFLSNYLYLENRKGWFPKADILSVVKALYNQNNTYGLDFKKSTLSAKKLNAKKAQILDQVRALDEILPDKTNATFRKGLKKFIANHKYSFDIDNVPNFTKEEPPLNKGAQASAEVYQLWDLIRENLQTLCRDEAYSLYNPYITVFERVMELFYEEASKDDVLFLEELNKRARSLFDEQGITVEEIYFRIATRITHYLIDEFQDTSRLQWANLRMMPEEALSTGGSLFYVGDRKQAIYGFRGGDIRLFDDVKKEFHSFVKTEPLLNNYRSHKNIVEFNNLIFSVNNLNRFISDKESREREKRTQARVEFHGDDYRAISNIFETSSQKMQPKLDKGYVRVERIDAKLKEESLELTRDHLLEVLKDVTQRFDYKDIAILTRNNSQIELITGWLLEEDVRVESERTSDVSENSRIKELIEFFKFLNSPIDNSAFARFIMGSIFTRTTGVSVEEFRSFIFKYRSQLMRQKDFYLYHAFRVEYADIWDKYILEFYQNVGLYPLYELAVSVYDRLDCMRNFPMEHGFFMHFLELIKNREEEHSDIASFLEYFDNLLGESLYVKIPDQNAVKILTVHKSKGLEFPVVIIPFLGMDVQVGSKSNDTAQSYVMQKHKDSMRLLRLKKTYYKYSDTLYSIYREEYKNSLISELNNVYVALTRASRELYCFIPTKVGNSYNLANFLVPEDFQELGEKYQFPKIEEGQPIEPLILEGESQHNWLSYLNDEHISSQHSDTYQQRRAGTILHYILAQIGNLNIEDDQDSIEKALIKAREDLGLYDDYGSYRRTIKSCVGNSNFRPFFYVDDGDVFNERELINRAGHSKRIDRLIIKNKEVWVVDYKSSRLEQARDLKQVQEYMEMIQTMYAGFHVRGFLLYLDAHEVEEING